MNTRGQAAEVMQRVLIDHESLSAALADCLSTVPAGKDRALIQALAYGVSRWFWELDFLLGKLCAKPIKDPYIKTLALTGLFQLRHMRVKPYAAVGETVAAAKRLPWAKPLLNGILRTYQREQASLETAIAENECARTSHPAWLIDRLRRDWPDDFPVILGQNNCLPPMTLRVNRLRTTRAAYLSRLREAGISSQPGNVASDSVIVDRPVGVDRLPGFAEGMVSVQDEAPQLAAGLLQLAPGQRVLDVCAAPGGKTVHLLEACPELQQVVALDISAERAALIRENLSRCGVAAHIITADAAVDSAWWDGQHFDRILLDAPCSATGVIRRHPDIKLLRKPEDIAQSSAQQRRILQSVWNTLRTGGRLLYATCSVLREENELNIEWFLRNHPDACEASLPELSDTATTHGRQMLPGDRGMDGFYYACLTKSA